MSDATRDYGLSYLAQDHKALSSKNSTGEATATTPEDEPTQPHRVTDTFRNVLAKFNAKGLFQIALYTGRLWKPL